MRLLVVLCLSAATALAAPQKTPLPTGALAILGTPAAQPPGAASPDAVQSLTFLDNRTLFVGTGIGWTTWDLEKRQPRQARPVGGPAWAVVGGPERLFVGSARQVHLIEPPASRTGEPSRSWESRSDAVGVLALDPTGRRLIFNDGELTLAILDLKSGTVTGRAELASRPVAALLTANGRILAVVTRDGATRLYRLEATGKLEQLWFRRVARSDRVGAAIAPDGRLLAVSSAGRVVLFDPITGRQLAGLERKFGEGDARTLAFSRDGRLLAVGTNGPDPVVRVWSVPSGQELTSFPGGRGDVNALAFSPDGRTLASGGQDQAVYLWAVPSPDPKPKQPADTTTKAWDRLDTLDAAEAYRLTGALLAEPTAAVEVIGSGFRNIGPEQARLRRCVAELDHDEFRVREVARRELLKAGLRGAELLTSPGRRPLGPEGEQRVRLILEAMESQGLRVPESGLYGEPLRSVRAIRVLETIGGNAARAVLEAAAKGPADALLTREARSALQTFPEPR